jgi:hypothetical protein
MKVHGACHCGKITYEAEVDPASASICNCTDCQTLSGAPFRASIAALAENFTLLSGQPKIYVKTAESGNKRAQGFCGDCGTAIYSTQAEKPIAYFLRVGPLRERTEIVPRLRIWCRSALPWINDLSKMEKREKH